MRSVLVIAAVASLPSAFAQTTVPDLPRAIYADPAVDLINPASTIAVEIPSHGYVMNGFIYRPAGRGPFPLIVLLHGLPGNEQNLDLAQALRRSGWAVLTFHYRGCFGSKGQFTIENALEDARVAVRRASDPAVARSWSIDPTQIVIIGHSMGGLAAARAAASEPQRLATILLAPWDPSSLAQQLRQMSRKQLSLSAEGLWGNVSSGRLTGISSQQIAEQIVAHGNRWRLADAAKGLSDRPLLIVTGARDRVQNKAIDLKSALQRDGANATSIEIDSGHSFDDHRIELESTVLRWLSQLRRSQLTAVPRQ
jgi:uncharacterized protein